VTWTQRKTGRRITHLTFEFSEKKPVKLKKPKTTTTKATPQPTVTKVDNVEYFADMRKKYGDKSGLIVPEDISEILKAQGRW
jgi:plasmid replication initiation protein